MDYKTDISTLKLLIISKYEKVYGIKRQKCTMFIIKSMHILIFLISIQLSYIFDYLHEFQNSHVYNHWNNSIDINVLLIF